jgi:predicted Zn-dependent peptidase
VVSGDVTPAQVQELARRHFGAWRARRPRAGAHGARHARRAGIVLVHRPGSVQSSIRVGHPGITRQPDYYSLQVMNAILGGMSTSRLERIIRSEHAWTYVARSSFNRPRGDRTSWASPRSATR